MIKSSNTRGAIAAIGLVLLAGCATPRAPVRTATVVAPAAAPTPAGWPEHPGGDTLWNIVSSCVRAAQGTPPDPGKCAEVSIASGVPAGFAVLKDRKGIKQYLVLPTMLITGIEDAQLLAPGATNYFAAAWRERVRVTPFGQPLARDDLSVAVNSFEGRTQDLLHLHVSCLRSDIRDVLRGQLATIGPAWGATVMLDGHDFQAMRIDGDDTLPVDPFATLAQGLKMSANEMGSWTLVLAGVTLGTGKPGFVLLAAHAQGAYKASGEDLQDHDCTGQAPPAR